MENSNYLKNLGTFNQYVKTLSTQGEVYLVYPEVKANNKGNNFVLFELWEADALVDELFIHCGPSVAEGQSNKDLHFMECVSSDGSGEVFPVAYSPKDRDVPRGERVF